MAEIRQQNKSFTGLIVLTMLASFITPFMGSSVNLALPQISAEFGMHAESMSWIAMSYILASAVFLLPFGALSDIVGRKKIFITGMVIFSVSCLLGAVSTSSVMLITFRVLQGLGSSMVFGTSMAMVTAAVPPEKRGRAIGIVVFAVYSGLAVAPVVGGLMTQFLGWRSIFWLSFTVCSLVSLGAFFWIHGDAIDKKSTTFDYGGSFIYIVSLSLFMYGFSKITELHALIMAISGIAGLTAFLIFEKKRINPVFNATLFMSNRIFAFSNLAALINYAATFAVGFMISLYLQYAKGMTPAEAGSTLIAQPVVMAITAPLAGRLSDRYQARWLSSLGMAIIVAGLLPFVFIGFNTSLTVIVVSLLILGTGFGIFSSPNTNAVMSSIEKPLYGVASATLGTMRLTGQMLSMGIASLAVHLFVGNNTIGSANIVSFIDAVRLVFIVFCVLCFAGIFASLARGSGEPRQV